MKIKIEDLKCGDALIYGAQSPAQFVGVLGENVVIKWSDNANVVEIPLDKFAINFTLPEAPSEPAPFPQIGDKYWYVTSWQVIEIGTWSDTDSQRLLLATGNVFPTEEAAKEYAKYLASDDHKKSFQAWQEKEAKPWLEFAGWNPYNQLIYIVIPGYLDVVNELFDTGSRVHHSAVADNRAFPYTEAGRLAAEARLADLRGGK